MRIEHIELINCGLHEHLVFDCGTGLVGLTGSNSSGKSTVLRMLRFALTGELEDTLESYVRQGAGNGSVRLRFRKHGTTYTVFRQFGKTAKRQLTWTPAGQPETILTGAKPIADKLASLFGVDQGSLQSAVFVEQGVLDQILFQGDADRRSQFIKLVNLGYCKQRADIAAAMMVEAGRQLQNLEPVLASSTQLLAEKEQAHAQALGVKAGLKDWTPLITAILDQLETSARRDERQLSLNQLTPQVQIRQQQLQELLETLGNQTQEGLQARHVQLQEERIQLTERIVKLDQLSEDARNYHRLDEERKANVTRQGVLKTQLDGLPLASALQAQQQTAQQQLNQLVERDQLTREITRLTEEGRQLNIKVRQLTEDLPAVEQALQLAIEQLRVATESRTLAGREYDFAQELNRCFAGVGKVDKAECPKCGLTVCDLQLPSAEELKLKQTQVLESETKLRTAKTHHQLKTQLAKTANDNLNSARSQQAATHTILVNREQRQRDLGAVGDNREALEEQLLELTTRLHTRSRLETETRLLETQLRQIVLDQLRLKEFRTVPAEDLTVTSAQARRHQCSNLDAEITATAGHLGRIENAASLLAVVNDAYHAECVQIEKLDQQLNQTLPEELTLLLETNANSLTAVRALLESRQKEWQEAHDAAQLTEAAMLAARQQVKDIQTSVEKDLDRRRLVTDLAKIKDLLSDGGLPEQVVQQHFKILTALTQKFLVELNANFCVQLDPTRALAFRFERQDGQPGILSMQKLSGGQRVRLCLAFLMAVQRHLVPDVGLLVLDEVSNHLDQEGVESLAELLRSMGSRLQNSDHQIWVVDHRPEIAGALECCKQL